MKQTIIVALLLIVTLVAAADERSAAALEKLRTTMRSYTSYRVDFTARVSGQGASSGSLLVSGERFNAKIMGSEFISDGQTLWNYTPADKEVTIEHLDPRNPSVLTNPSRLLGIDPNDYNHKSLDTQGRNLELVPKVSNPDYSSINLLMDDHGAVQQVKINSTTQVEPIIITIGKLTPNVAVSLDDFMFDTKAHKSVEVIDFRAK